MKKILNKDDFKARCDDLTVAGDNKRDLAKKLIALAFDPDNPLGLEQRDLYMLGLGCRAAFNEFEDVLIRHVCQNVDPDAVRESRFLKVFAMGLVYDQNPLWHKPFLTGLNAAPSQDWTDAQYSILAVLATESVVLPEDMSFDLFPHRIHIHMDKDITHRLPFFAHLAEHGRTPELRHHALALQAQVWLYQLKNGGAISAVTASENLEKLGISPQNADNPQNLRLIDTADFQTRLDNLDDIKRNFLFLPSDDREYTARILERTARDLAERNSPGDAKKIKDIYRLIGDPQPLKASGDAMIALFQRTAMEITNMAGGNASIENIIKKDYYDDFMSYGAGFYAKRITTNKLVTQINKDLAATPLGNKLLHAMRQRTTRLPSVELDVQTDKSGYHTSFNYCYKDYGQSEISSRIGLNPHNRNCLGDLIHVYLHELGHAFQRPLLVNHPDPDHGMPLDWALLHLYKEIGAELTGAVLAFQSRSTELGLLAWEYLSQIRNPAMARFVELANGQDGCMVDLTGEMKETLQKGLETFMHSYPIVNVYCNNIIEKATSEPLTMKEVRDFAEWASVPSWGHPLSTDDTLMPVRAAIDDRRMMNDEEKTFIDNLTRSFSYDSINKLKARLQLVSHQDR
ncbi:MAG: hypothetical protein U9N14_08025 [Pseudomonadota bacterium]|nr:hypothetical protein [Pseudomonadota bacterium]